MIKDVWDNKVMEGDYKLREDCQSSYSKLLDKESKYNDKWAGHNHVSLDPYSTIFSGNPTPFDSFNNKKFSII